MATHHQQPDSGKAHSRPNEPDKAPDEDVPQKDNPAEPENDIADHPEDQNTG